MKLSIEDYASINYCPLFINVCKRVLGKDNYENPEFTPTRGDMANVMREILAERTEETQQAERAEPEWVRDIGLKQAKAGYEDAKALFYGLCRMLGVIGLSLPE